MNKLFKKSFLLLMVVFSAIAIASCDKDSDDTIYYEVKYMVENTEMAKYFVEEGQTASPIAAKEFDGKTFKYWTLNGKEYDFTTPVTSDLTFIAEYTNNETPVTPDTPVADVSEEVKAELEKIVADATYSVTEINETENLKAKYIATKGNLTTTIYYLEKANIFTTVKMYVGVNSGKIINVVVTASDTLGKNDSFNGTSLGVIGSTSSNLDDNFTAVSGATVSSTTVKELLAYALELYVTDNEGSSDNQMVTVTFDTDGGTKINTLTVENGSTFVRPNDPTRSLYHFTGWYLNDKPYDFTAPVTKDITLTAKWVTIFQFDSKTKTIVDAVDLAGDVEIPTLINGMKVLNLGENLFKGNESITSVTIPSTIENIEFSAFEGCTALEKVTFLADENSNPITFGINLFKGCTSLKDITIPANASTVAAGMFEGCTSLKKLPFAGSVTSIGNTAFKGCTALEEIVLPEGLASINKNAFEGCTNLGAITFPESLVVIGEQSFKDCTSLVRIYIPAKVYNINLNAFDGCTNLGTISVSADNTKYSSEDGALYNKTKTTLMLVPNRTLKTFEIISTVTSIDTNAFANLVNLETVTVNEESTKYVSDGGVLYSKSTYSGNEVTKLELIPAKFSGTVKFLKNTNNTASNVFANCPNISGIEVDSENDWYVEIDHIIYRRASKTSTYYTLAVANRNYAGVATILKDTNGTLSKVENDAFVNTKLTGIRITWSTPKVSINSNIFASVPEGFKIYIPNGTTSAFVDNNKKWSGIKDILASMIVEDAAESTDSSSEK